MGYVGWFYVRVHAARRAVRLVWHEVAEGQGRPVEGAAQAHIERDVRVVLMHVQPNVLARVIPGPAVR